MPILSVWIKLNCFTDQFNSATFPISSINNNYSLESLLTLSDPDKHGYTDM